MTSAETEAAAPAISSNLPFPIKVAGSGRSRRWVNSPAICAPALLASVRSSSSDSSDVKSGESAGKVVVDDEAPTLAAWSRAACALRVMPRLFPAPPLLRNSTPTRKARSCCSDGLRTALSSFRELPRPFNLESSLRKQTHFTLRCRRRSWRSLLPLAAPDPIPLVSAPRGDGPRAKLPPSKSRA